MSLKQIITTTLTILIISFLLIFPNISNSINSGITNLYSSISGEEKPDSNIILIHISSNDIESLGDWPLKRSYYALLINSLTELNVRKIGLEIFLSNNLTSQNIYNDVLNSAIEKSGRVVLSSLLEDIRSSKNEFISSKINFPSPKIYLDELLTGHINFLSDNGVIIPSKVNFKNIYERSFSEVLAGTKRSGENIKVNFISDWQKFSNYSLLEFFDLVETSDTILKTFENKTIIVGVSDPLIAKTMSVNFNEELPGIALHAFALENLMNERNINYNYYSLSKYVLYLVALILSFIFLRNKLYLAITACFLLVFYFLYSSFYTELEYSAILLPLTGLILTNFGFRLLESKEQLDKSLSESENLKSELKIKEDKLRDLKSNISKQSNAGLELKINELETDIESLKNELANDNEIFTSDGVVKNFEGIVFRSSKMEKICQLIRKVSPETASVLIMGESGSGKELVANAIHKLSKRKENNFVAVNCAALPDNLLESELFGHVKGAFTDAIKDKIGRFEEADGGTLFLDEIGETSENFQVKLLRILQSGDFQKVGSSETQHADVRIVTATNKNLHELVQEGKFREDLFYRLNVIIIELPKLNERKEDIEILAQHFAQIENGDISITKGVMNKLVANEWKGNIRELESTIKRAVIFAKSENRKIIKLKDLPEELSKIDKNELEDLIIDSLREKEFSHSSIIDTSKELGGISRTVVSENYRGHFLKIYAQNNFDLDKAVELIAVSDDLETQMRVKSKLETFISNIEKDLQKHSNSSFDEVKNSFSSKYRNLPQKFHSYLDIVIKELLLKLPEK